jgi:hypothetical protein
VPPELLLDVLVLEPPILPVLLLALSPVVEPALVLPLVEDPEFVLPLMELSELLLLEEAVADFEVPPVLLLSVLPPAVLLPVELPPVEADTSVDDLPVLLPDLLLSFVELVPESLFLFWSDCDSFLSFVAIKI